jgi:hypothetical protein
MYTTKENYVCDICREEVNSIELENWKKNNPDILTSWDGARPDLSLKLRESGYYKWDYPPNTKETVTINADCHGDSMTMCKRHMSEYFESIWNEG